MEAVDMKKINPDDPINQVLKEFKLKIVPTVKKLKKEVKSKKKPEKKSESVRLENKEVDSLEIINSGYAQVYDEVNNPIRKRKSYKPKDNIDQWKPTDFALYIRNLYWDKYQEDWGLVITGVASRITKVMDAFHERMGYYSNLAFKKYIDYFFERHISRVTSERTNSFFFDKLYSKELMHNFKLVYNPAKETIKENKKKEKENTEITEELLNNSLLLGETNLICNYGLILAYNFMKYRGFDEEEIENNILDVCKQMFRSGNFDTIKKSTAKYKYPSYLNSFDFNKILKNVDKNISINIEFINQDIEMFNFLKEKNV